MSEAKPFGWDVEVEFHLGAKQERATFHFRGCTEGAARRKAGLKRLVKSIVSVTPVTEEQWIRAYGIGRM